MKAILIFFIGWIVGSCASSTIHSNRSPSQANLPDLDKDVATLKTFLEKRTVVLDRDLVTFHYAEQDHANFHPNSLKEAQGLLAGLAELFFNASSREGESYEQGPGVYVAVDPFASREFGKNDPKLYVITIPKGARVLITSTPYIGNEKSVMDTFYSKYHCESGATVAPQRFADTIGFLRRANVEGCRQLVLRAFQDVGIEAIEYPYPGASTLEGCRHSRGVAFNIVKSSAIPENGLAYYDNHSKLESQPISAALARLYDESSLEFSLQLSEKHLEPIGSWSGSISPADYTVWKNQNVYKCGPRWTLETGDPSERGREAIYVSSQRRNILEAGRKLRDAFVKRFENHELFDLDLINRIEQLTFEADRSLGSVDFETWKRAKDLLHKSETINKGIKLAAEALSESKPSVEIDEEQTPVLKLYLRIKSLPATYFKLGMGPRVTRMETNKIMVAVGGAPYLGELPRDAKRDSSRLKQKNERDFLDILNQCTQTMLDQKISNEEIQNGPCGIRTTSR